MTKKDIIERMEVNHASFISFFAGMNSEDFMYAPEEKWSAGQQLDHIRRALKPLRLLLGLPKWAVRILVKKANRPSRTYEELIEKYTRKLKEGGRASGRFIPLEVKFSEKNNLLKKVEKEVLAINRSLVNYQESELDHLVLPHPLLGYITLREMMYFTIYHVQHHQNLSLNNLERKPKLHH